MEGHGSENENVTIYICRKDRAKHIFDIYTGKSNQEIRDLLQKSAKEEDKLGLILEELKKIGETLDYIYKNNR